MLNYCLFLGKFYSAGRDHERLQVVKIREVFWVHYLAVCYGYSVAIGIYLCNKNWAVLSASYKHAEVMGYFYLSDWARV